HRVVAADALEPLHVLQRRELLGAEPVHLALGPRGEREELEHVGAEEALGVEHGELAADQGPCVGAVRAVGLVAEPPHEGVPHAGDAGHGPGAPSAGSLSGVLKPNPGIEGMTTWKASSARPPWATGSVSGPIMSRKSRNEPGEVWVSASA